MDRTTADAEDEAEVKLVSAYINFCITDRSMAILLTWLSVLLVLVTGFVLFSPMFPNNY